MDDVAEGDRILALGQELRRVHRKLRDAVDLARAAIEAGQDPDLANSDLQVYCGGYCLALTEHHLREDDVLFRMLEEREPELKSVLRILSQDHSMLAHLIGRLQAALSSGADTDALLDHLDGIEAVMSTHFTYEEKVLVDRLDDLTPPVPGAVDALGSLAG